jgi:HEAT repeat protein
MLAQFGIAAISGLLETLENPQPLVRDYSAWALGMIGSSAEPAIPALCRATQDANSSVRYAAIMALNNIGKSTDDVINCLLDALADPDEANQRAIRNALKKLKGV